MLSQLIQQGLVSDISLVRVAGVHGVGRRRLIRSVIGKSDNLEWVDLAPSQGPPVFSSWIRGELLDFLGAYPKLPIPSWSLHVLASVEPTIQNWSSMPTLSRETLPRGVYPELVGAAVAQVVLGLTAYSPVVVHAGLWPEDGSAASRALHAMEKQLRRPGALLVAAGTDVKDPDASHQRTLVLKNLSPREVNTLAERWSADTRGPRFGAWLYRATNGHPLFLSEIVRWLEESGFVHVMPEQGRVSLLEPLRKLPIPMSLSAVTNSRFKNLPLSAQHVLDLIKQNEGRLTFTDLRRRYEGRDAQFEQAYALLRRRCYFYRPIGSHPHALSSPLLHQVINAPSKRKFPRRKIHKPAPHVQTLPGSPLAGVFDLLRQTEEVMQTGDTHPRELLTRGLRLTRSRTGRAWVSAHGRFLFLNALQHYLSGRLRRSLRVSRIAESRLARDIHPGLFQNIFSLRTRVYAELGDHQKAQGIRVEALNEALMAGHLVRSGHLMARVAEGHRRLGRLEQALEAALQAIETLQEMGLPHNLPALTRRETLFDLRRVPEALLDAGIRAESAPVMDPIKLAKTRYVDPVDQGWGSDFDQDSAWQDARALIGRVASLGRVENPLTTAKTARDLEGFGWLGLAADLQEVCSLAQSDQERFRNKCLDGAVHLNHRLSSERNQFLARGIDASLTGTLPETRKVLHRARLHVVRRETEPGRRLRITLLGSPCLNISGESRPLSLMPEWWRRSFAEALCLELTGDEIPVSLLNEARHAAGEAPFESPERGLARFNRILSSHGGLALELHGNHLSWDWQSAGTDAKEILALLNQEPPDLHHISKLVRGPFLPDHSTPAVGKARQMLLLKLRQAFHNAQLPWALEDGQQYVHWMEGPARYIDCWEPAAKTLRNLGRPRAASLLDRA